MLVTAWDGTDESDLDLETTEDTDVMYLINQDRPKGDVVRIRDQKMHFRLRKQRDIHIPIDRIKQIHFRSEEIPQKKLEQDPSRIRAHFAGGGSLSFNLISWDHKKLEGKSEHFRPLQFTGSAIRQIEFNLQHQSQKHDQAADTYWNMEHQP